MLSRVLDCFRSLCCYKTSEVDEWTLENHSVSEQKPKTKPPAGEEGETLLQSGSRSSHVSVLTLIHSEQEKKLLNHLENVQTKRKQNRKLSLSELLELHTDYHCMNDSSFSVELKAMCEGEIGSQDDKEIDKEIINLMDLKMVDYYDKKKPLTADQRNKISYDFGILAYELSTKMVEFKESDHDTLIQLKNLARQCYRNDIIPPASSLENYNQVIIYIRNLPKLSSLADEFPILGQDDVGSRVYRSIR